MPLQCQYRRTKTRGNGYSMVPHVAVTCLVLVALAVEVSGGGGGARLTVKLNYFSNPSNMLNDSQCDKSPSSCNSSSNSNCSYYFVMCIVNQISNASNPPCQSDPVTSPAFSSNSSSTPFPSNFTPLSLNFIQLQSTTSIRIFIYITNTTRLVDSYIVAVSSIYNTTASQQRSRMNGSCVICSSDASYCSEIDVTTTVSCEPFYFGTTCAVYCNDTDDCNGGHYTCNETDGSKLCRQGWKGDNCSQPMTKADCPVAANDCGFPRNCSNNVCQNGGQCLDLSVNNALCVCHGAFTGQRCEFSIHSCSSAPCSNDGTCLQLLPSANDTSYWCVCSEGFRGTNCEVKNPCHSWPCLNNATCSTNTSNSEQYTCTCSKNYTGERCERFNDTCLSMPCQSGATCVAGNQGMSFTCHCPPDRRGYLCDELMACVSAPCMHNAQCVNVYQGGYSCYCPPGYSGAQCEKESLCVTDVCANCVSDGSSITCSCPIASHAPDPVLIQTAIGLGTTGGILLLLLGVIILWKVVTPKLKENGDHFHSRRESEESPQKSFNSSSARRTSHHDEF